MQNKGVYNNSRVTFATWHVFVDVIMSHASIQSSGCTAFNNA